jgi:cobalamin biosynthesis protein CobD/CbiB
MIGTHYRTRARYLRRILRGVAAFLIVSSVCLAVSVVVRPHMTTVVAIVTAAAALVIILLALALRMAFRDLPELEQLAAKFDDEAAVDRNGKADARDGGER